MHLAQASHYASSAMLWDKQDEFLLRSRVYLAASRERLERRDEAARHLALADEGSGGAEPRDHEQASAQHRGSAMLGEAEPCSWSRG